MAYNGIQNFSKSKFGLSKSHLRHICSVCSICESILLFHWWGLTEPSSTSDPTLHAGRRREWDSSDGLLGPESVRSVFFPDDQVWAQHGLKIAVIAVAFFLIRLA